MAADSAMKVVATRLAAQKTLTTKIEDPSLLRGIRISTLLGGFGLHFKARNLAAQSFTEDEALKLYARSQQVQQLDYFVSHSWRSSRAAKVLALLINCNMVAASIISILVALIFLILQFQGLLPKVEVSENSGDPTYWYFPWCYFAGCLTFFLAYFYWQNVPSMLGLSSSFFFDKLCVHQFDEDRKLAGILSFGAYVANCRHFVLLWDKIHFSRLWCVLEIASLVKAHQHEGLPLIFLPLSLAVLSVMGWVVLFFCQGIYSVNRCLGQILPATPLVVVVVFIGSVGLAHSTRKYMSQRKALSTYLSHFKVTETECFLERDREFVNNTLIEWFGSLEAFDHHVHTTVRQKVLATIGSDVHFPLKYVWPLFLIRAFQEMDGLSTYGTVISKDDLGANIAATMAWAFLLLTCFPVCLRIANFIPEFKRAWVDILVTFAVGTVYALYTFSLWFFSNQVVPLLPEYVSYSWLVLSFMWLLWLQRGSFNGLACRRDPPAASSSPPLDAATKDAHLVAAANDDKHIIGIHQADDDDPVLEERF